MIETLIFWIIAIVIIYIIVKIFSKPIKIFFKLAFNSLLGIILLNLYNYYLAAMLNFYIPVNVVTALIVGFLGVPGFILVVFLKFFVGV